MPAGREVVVIEKGTGAGLMVYGTACEVDPPKAELRKEWTQGAEPERS